MKTFLGLLIIFSCFAFTFFHHGWANYDQNNPIKFTGEILNSTYENPHGMADIKAEDGKTWKVVLAPPSRMQSRGLQKEMLKKGTTAQILGYQHKEDENEMRAENITINNKTVELR
jgi:hypothetical protein